MARKRGKRKPIQIKDLKPRAPIVARSGVRAGLRGITSIILGALGAEGGETRTWVTDKKGKTTQDKDTSVSQDYYVA